MKILKIAVSLGMATITYLAHKQYLKEAIDEIKDLVKCNKK